MGQLATAGNAVEEEGQRTECIRAVHTCESCNRYYMQQRIYICLEQTDHIRNPVRIYRRGLKEHR